MVGGISEGLKYFSMSLSEVIFFLIPFLLLQYKSLLINVSHFIIIALITIFFCSTNKNPLFFYLIAFINDFN